MVGVRFKGRLDYKAHVGALSAKAATLRRMTPQELFRPGVVLLNRLRYPYKFGLIGLVATVSIGFFVVSLMVAMSADLNAARDERTGLDVYPAAARLTQLVQQSQGLTVGALNGEEALKQPAQTKRDEIDAAVQALAAASREADLGLDGRVKDIAGEWQALRGKLDALQAKDAATAYARLDGLLDDFMRDLGEASKLIGDSSPTSSYVADILIRKLPQLTEQIALLQAYGEGLLVTRDLDASWKQAGVVFHGAARGRTDLLDALTRAARAAQANPVAQAQLDGVRQAIAPGLDEFFALSEREVIKAAFTANVGDLNTAAAHAQGPLYAQTDRILVPMLRATLDARIARLSQQFWADMTVAGVIVLLLVYASLAMFSTIVGSVSELADGAARIGEGDLAARIEFSSRDELRDVAEQFNGMATSFAGVITGIKGTVQSLNDSAAALTASAGRVSQGSERQSEAASTMAASIEEMTVGIDEISRHAAAADEVSQQTGQLSKDGGEVVAQTVAEMERIAEAVNQSAEVIRELGRNSARISSIVGSIKEIADQTNLLALNASIEAARAGEQGRGFAVVADEVRKLAERTGRATQEITGMVGSIQSGTNRAVDAMQDGVARVRSGVELTKQAGESMRRISDESGRVVQSVSDISLALREQSSASTEIAQNVERIAQMAEENGSVVADAAATASQLETLARQLSGEVSRFRV